MIRKLFKPASLLLAVALCAQGNPSSGQSPNRSQPKFGMGIITMLLMDPEVTAELKVTDEQKQKVMDIGTNMQEDIQQAYQNGGDPSQIQQTMQKLFEETKKKQLAVLTADQNKRLREIFVQDNGIGSITDSDVQKDLGFQDKQTKKVADLQASYMKAMGELGSKLQSQQIDSQQFQELSNSNQKVMIAELTKLLTADQRKKLKAMEGKPFKRKGFSLPTGPGGPGAPG